MSEGPVQVVTMDCGCIEKCQEFSRVSSLTYHPNHGMREVFSYYRCMQCGRHMDTVQMVAEAGLERKRKELRELELEIQQQER